MGEILYGKLVRDKIPEIISADGETPVTRVLGTTEFRRELLLKLLEEVKELVESDGDISELADVAEVQKALHPLLGYTDEEIEAARAAKAETRGGFEQRIYLEKAITND